LIIEVTHEDLKVPDGELVYVKPKKYVKEPKYVDVSSTFSPPPDFRGIDLRGLNENLWCWDVYFGLNLDRSIKSQASVRGGDLILSAKVLPNGGKIVVKERKMTSEERILFGLETDPNAKNPFAPQQRNKSVEVR
tara:strand:+ start:148 stop:552 length:405 start_codon:yes stop_codon:yes gene_type:complete